jgi:hypothetical protein
VISRRTIVLLVVAIAAMLALGVVAHGRQALCHEESHGFSRRARIVGDSGTDTFVCSAMYKHMPVQDGVLVLFCFFSGLAVVRSLAIDKVVWQQAQRKRWIDP